MFEFVFGGVNYVGPMKHVLDQDRRTPQILDLGTGGGHWSVCGIDLTLVALSFTLKQGYCYCE